jgi:K+/H+ antiporter YhaU regulatory subunit KhtT
MALTLAQKIPLKGIQNLFSITDNFKIVDTIVPLSYIGKRFLPIDFCDETHLKIVAIRRDNRILYSSAQNLETQNRLDIEFIENDTLILAGDIKDIKRFLRD